MIKLLSDAIGRIFSNFIPYSGPRLVEPVKYDLLINYEDEDREKTVRTFSTETERDLALAKLMLRASRQAAAGQSEKDVIASVVFDDRVLFWRRSAAQPELPKSPPSMPGFRNKVLRILTTNKGCIETEGYSIANSLRALAAMSSAECPLVPIEAFVIDRRTVAQRGGIALTKVG